MGTAEAIPLRDRSVDLITAAGSLNYANLDLFFPEAARVLLPHGVLVVYDFSPGRSFRDCNQPGRVVCRFLSTAILRLRNEARELSPGNSGRTGFADFACSSHEHFEIGIPMTPSFIWIT